MWQALHVELEARGLTVVTVALDTDVEAARPSHEDAAPTHPALVDPTLSLVDTFGITNVPFGVWIDERGHLVRPAEPAFTPPLDRPPPERLRQRPSDTVNVPPEHLPLYDVIIDAIGDNTRYVGAVRDWVEHGPASRFVMPPAEVIAASRARPWDHALAAAEFELGQHLYAGGRPDAATEHFERAHQLDPENWSFVRQAYSLGDANIPRVMAEVARLGAETFYPRLDM